MTKVRLAPWDFTPTLFRPYESSVYNRMVFGTIVTSFRLSMFSSGRVPAVPGPLSLGTLCTSAALNVSLQRNPRRLTRGSVGMCLFLLAGSSELAILPSKIYVRGSVCF